VKRIVLVLLSVALVPSLAEAQVEVGGIYGIQLKPDAFGDMWNKGLGGFGRVVLAKREKGNLGIEFSYVTYKADWQGILGSLYGTAGTIRGASVSMLQAGVSQKIFLGNRTSPAIPFMGIGIGFFRMSASDISGVDYATGVFTLPLDLSDTDGYVALRLGLEVRVSSNVKLSGTVAYQATFNSPRKQIVPVSIGFIFMP